MQAAICKNKIYHRLLMLLIMIGICFSVSAIRTESVYAKTYKIKTAADWKNIGKKNGGTFKLVKNIKLKSKKQYLTITKNKKYVIDLNGHKVVDNGTGSQNSPLTIKKGTVTLKTSKKSGGVIYSKEWMSVKLEGKAKLYVKSGGIVNDPVEFRTGTASAIYMSGNSKCYLQGSAVIQGVNNGVSMLGKSSLFMTGNPRVRAGALNSNMAFTHYGSGICIVESGCKVSLQGGSVGTKATPDVSSYGMKYTMSGSYPVLDREGKSLKLDSRYKYLDYKGNEVPITGSYVDYLYQRITGLSGSSGFNGECKLTTSVQDPEGYYTVFILKK